MGKLKEEEIMCKVISVVNQKETLHREYIQPTEARLKYLKM